MSLLTLEDIGRAFALVLAGLELAYGDNEVVDIAYDMGCDGGM